MGTSLAFRNLLEHKVRTLVAIAGVCFAITLVFMQLGFFAAVTNTAVLIYDSLQFDIVLCSPRYVVLTQAGSFPHRRLYQAQAHPDVARVMPLHVRYHLWRNPLTRRHWGVVVLGIRPTDPVSTNPEIEQLRPLLAKPDTVLIDRLSRRDVGPQDRGLVVEVGPRNLTIIGQFTIGPGFENAVILVGDETFAALYGGAPLDKTTLGLVQLRPGAEPDRVAEELRRQLPSDVQVFTRAQMKAHEQHYWIVSTSTGVIFGAGVIVALLFGVVIIYQVLSLEVSNRLPEYATLKAMGFSDRYLALVVLQQGVIFSALSYIPAYVQALVIYRVSVGLTNLPVYMTTTRAVTVFFLSLVMSSLSGLLALRILRRADPVDLF
jgi:putative ABC transport system permease protein